jgi:hypothetical protein
MPTAEGRVSDNGNKVKSVPEVNPNMQEQDERGRSSQRVRQQLVASL